MKRTIPPLVFAWISVAGFLVWGEGWIQYFINTPWMVFLFIWLISAVMASAFTAVREAELLAEKLGEPVGTIILTLAVVVIEVVLISAVMLDGTGSATLGRDTMFAVVMIMMNGVVGAGLLLGGLKHREQTYNLQGAAAYLAVMIPLSVTALIIPNFTLSTSGGTLSHIQSICFSAFTLLLYAIFLAIQTGRHKEFFVEPTPNSDDPDDGRPSFVEFAESSLRVGTHVLFLLASIVPVIFLSKSLARILDYGMLTLHIPAALGGVIIAMIVLAPESISALRAACQNQLQRAINLSLGSALSTIGLTVPAILTIGLWMDQTVVLGLTETEMALLAVTLLVSTITFSGAHTTVLQGAVHLVLFMIYIVLIFSP